ncbi:MAG: L-seryl-tRNA(Sec) selenium transferase [Clostridiales bacterium]|jgi:L-seryl-tRNA(Ser) seleniumtransferase|nr:L-seryl-tRNA(Sec) selenium transferase [Clostridiales bacterium]
MDKNLILRDLPGMDRLLQEDGVRKAAAEAVLSEIRAEILAGEIAAVPPYAEILKLVRSTAPTGLKRVINATGVVLHTNLGRAPLAARAADAVARAAAGYSDLEFDLKTGERGSRLSELRAKLRALTNAEDALAVNNNAAAVLLALSALCAGREVVVSRGELVEIGGSFRVPEVIAQGGARLREVGATNAVNIADYANAISDETAALLKVHTSNYRILGYTKEVSVAELAELAKNRGLPLIYDLGGGSLVDIGFEPKVQEIVAQGADIVCFSGDKLLGGPQAGIILGRADLIEKCRKHPLYRALRLDKLSLAALCATLEIYENLEQAGREIPVLSMLTASPAEILQKARDLLALVSPQAQKRLEIVETSAQAGGGSLPGAEFPSYALALREPAQLKQALRTREIPIIARVHRDMLLLDLRTIDPDDFTEIATALGELL